MGEEMSIPENTGDFALEFKEFLDCFVVVGGTPTAMYLEKRGGVAKATQDLDVVVIERGDEKRSKEFFEKLRGYIKDHGYETEALASGKAQSYRFSKPKTTIAPKLIEIASEREDGIVLGQATQRHEEFDMSSIVCESHIISLLEAHTERFEITTGVFLPVPKPSLLIIMKAFAAINLEKSDKPEEQRKHKKHLVDIAKLGTILTEDDSIQVPAVAFAHLEELFTKGPERFPKDRLKDCGWSKGTDHQRVEEVVRAFIKVG